MLVPDPASLDSRLVIGTNPDDGGVLGAREYSEYRATPWPLRSFV